MGGDGVSEIVKKINDFYFLLTMWTGWGVGLLIKEQISATHLLSVPFTRNYKG